MLDDIHLHCGHISEALQLNSIKVYALTCMTLFLLCGEYSQAEENLCPGDQLNLTCSTDETFLQWSIINSQRTLSRLVSFQGVARELESLSLNFTTFYVSKISDDGVLPLISTILVYNVTNGLNGTVLNCTEIAKSGQIQGMLTTIIHIIGSDPFPPERITVAMESFGRNSALVNLEWSLQTGAAYTVTEYTTTTQIVYIILMSSVQLTLSYNILYNVSVVATLCGKDSTPITLGLTYAKCGNIQQLITDNLISIKDYNDPAIEGSNVSFSCPPGLVVTGPNTSTCNENGAWEPSPRQLECKVDCRVPVAECHVRLNYTSTFEDSLLLFWCEDGFVPDNIFTSICNRNTSWVPNPSRHTCASPLSANCGHPLPPKNGFIIQYTSTVEGARVKYSCNSSLEDVKTTVCSQEGTWEPSPIEVCDHEINQRCSSSQWSRDTIIAITSSLTVLIFSSVVFFSFGCLCHHLTQKYKQNVAHENMDSPEGNQPRQPALIYDDILPRRLDNDENRDVEMRENAAYDPMS